MTTLPRRLLAIAAIVTFLVWGNLFWEPIHDTPPPTPTPGPNAECWYRYQPSVGFDLWETVEVCE